MRRMRSDQRQALLFAVITAAWVLPMLALDLHTALLYLAPALLLFTALLSGKFPGEDLLVRAVAARTPRRTEPRQRSLPRPHRRLVRGSALLGSSLAGRAPPPCRAPQVTPGGAAGF
jgi:hypothetical protein